ncbi:MAG: anhydro-N-acetylmuramic acid kinase [Hyphomonadaceae bacterium]|nr:anhydro-N-acetylmuramic acid kinase [Hyphomonadaceae bacterium]
MTLKSVKAIGLMSGTSLDGIDVAAIDTDGHSIEGFGPSFFRPYSAEERLIIENSTKAALKWNFSGPPPNIFAQAQAVVDRAHIEAVSTFLENNALSPTDIDLIGYHGQTILHRPPETARNGQTLQLGNGDEIARATGIATVFDFRTNDMRHGGQGAPLAPVFHKALVDKAVHGGTTGILNIGGVSNITIVTETGGIFATDCGPGNGPLDTWISQNSSGSFDKDGRISLTGTPDFKLVDKWLRRDFFRKSAPKSADRWDFDVLGDLSGVSVENGAATLVAFTAISIKHTLANARRSIDQIIVCGGGRHNPAMLAALREQRISQIKTAEEIGWQGDDIEAQAFAYLAVRTAKQLPISYPETTGVERPCEGGRLADTK